MSSPPFRPLLPLLGVLAALLAGCSGPAVPPTARPDVLLLTIDTLRGDRWGCLGDPFTRTPWMDRLARGGVLAASCPEERFSLVLILHCYHVTFRRCNVTL